MIPLQKSFVFDLNKCTGCQACGVACKIENGVPAELDWRQVHTFNELRHPDLPVFHLSMACNHCVDPPCLQYCPALAYNKDARTGAVIIDPDKCIGCKYCSWSCPYDAPRFNPQKRVMEKCTFCNHRLADGQSPACVAGCPTGALNIEDFRGAEVDPVPGFTPTGIRPAIRLIPLRDGNTIPEAQFAGIEAGAFAAAIRRPLPKITARSEWTLLLFTLTAALMFATMTAEVFGTDPLIHPWLFLGAGILAMTLSTLHLGQKLRAWRAILNWRRSWLSREILCFSAFMAASFAALILFPGYPVVGYATVFLGLCALISIDQVYQVMAVSHRRPLHSAQVVWTALLLAGILLDLPFLYVAAGAFKMVLYVLRKQQEESLPSATSLARLVLGFLAPATIGLLGGPLLPVILSVLAGEFIDRCEFYSGLDLITPTRQIQQDMSRALRSH